MKVVGRLNEYSQDINWLWLTWFLASVWSVVSLLWMMFRTAIAARKARVGEIVFRSISLAVTFTAMLLGLYFLVWKEWLSGDTALVVGPLVILTLAAAMAVVELVGAVGMLNYTDSEPLTEVTHK